MALLRTMVALPSSGRASKRPENVLLELERQDDGETPVIDFIVWLITPEW